MILDGFFVIHVTNAGYTSEIALCFAPNPPPIRGLTTLTLDFGMLSPLAIIRLAWNGICVEEMTLILP